MTKFLPPSEIEAAAEAFLRKHHPARTVPIPIEEILDLQLKLNIIPVPGLFNHGIDAFLSGDLNNLYIDQEHLEYRISRARFTFAHEAGHLSLHSSYILSQRIASVESWKKIILGEGSGRDSMEIQANMFASFLLMPSDHLEKEFEQVKATLRRHPDFKDGAFPEDSVLAPYAANNIAKIFDVSVEYAQYRLINWINHRKKSKYFRGRC